MIRVAPIIVTNYSVIANNACGDAFDVMKVDVISKPKANASVVKNNLSVNFTNNSLGAQTYLWIFGDGKTDTSKNPIHNYTQVGNIKAKLIVFNICGNDTFEMNYFVSTINEIRENNIFVIHPNPAKEYVMIDWSEKIEVKKVKVYNAIGQEMILAILYNNYRIQVNTNSLASGIYQLHIIGDNSTEIQQIIVER